MIEHVRDFGEWEQEITGVEAVYPDEQCKKYLATLEPARYGLWKEFLEDNKLPYSSLDFAKQIQAMTSGLSDDEQRAEILGMTGELDKLAEDIRGKRVVARMDDGAISGNIGGYTVLDNERAMITLRMYEIAHGVNNSASKRADTSNRFTGPIFTPVLAIRGLSLIAR